LASHYTRRGGGVRGRGIKNRGRSFVRWEELQKINIC